MAILLDGKIKRLFALLLSLALLISMVGCSMEIESDDDEDEAETTEQTEDPEETDPEETQPEETEPADDPDASREDQELNTYKPVLDMFYESVSCKWTNLDEEGWNDVDDPDSVCYIFWHYEKDRTLDEVGYRLIDLNHDNQSELIVSFLHDNEYGSIYNMYTIVDGTVICVISAGERDRYSLAEDYSINNDGSSGAASSVFINYQLNAEGKLQIREGVIYDGYLDSENPWFYTNSGEYGIESDALQPISQEKAGEVMDSFPKNMALDLTPFQQYPYESNQQTPGAEENKIQTIRALNALLVGVEYDYTGKVSRWSDEQVCDVMWGKLLWDRYGYDNASYLYQYGLQARYDNDGYVHFDLDQIQKITKDTLGRDFPTAKKSDYFYVSGDEVLMMEATGESRTLVIQDYTVQGNQIRAVGTAIRSHNIGSEFLGYFEAVFEKNPESIYGYTLYSLYALESNQGFENLTAQASSALTEGSVTHSAGNVLDGNLSTAWAEGVSGDGINQWIRLETADGSKIHVSAIQFAMGYQKSDKLLEENGWPSEVLIQAEDGYRQLAELYYYDDVILLDHPVTSSWIEITILQAGSGTKYDDTCISEIMLYGIDAEAFFNH